MWNNVNELIDVNVFESSDEDNVDVHRRIRSPRKFAVRRDYFEELDDIEFFQRFRLRKRTCLLLLAEIENTTAPNTERNQAISASTKLLLTLRFFATGSMLIVVGDFVGVSKASACVIVKEVSEAIASLRPQYIKMCVGEAERQVVMERFYRIARFPCVVGAIDCTHVRLQSPGGENAELYRNRKGYFSWNVQTICDADLRIQDIVVRWPGSTHDSHTFNSSRIKARFDSGQFGNGILLGDSGYANNNYLLTPLPQPEHPSEQLYNESQIRTRNVIECSYGEWKRRFPILSLGMRVSLLKSQTIVIATAVLHNIAINEKNGVPDNKIQIDIEDNPIEDNNNLVREERNIGNYMRRTDLIRNHFTNLL